MDAQGFDALVTKHHGEIYRYLCRVVSGSGAAEDLTQETFLRAYRAHRGLPDDANARAWLFTIATNVARNDVRAEVRRRRAHTAVREAWSGVDGAGPEDATLVNETRAALAAAIDALPFKQRLAFTLRKVHDVDYETIGQSLECSAESARAHVFQALRKIRRSWNGCGPASGGNQR